MLDQIYELDPYAQAKSVLSKISINFSEGIKELSTEVDVTSRKLSPAIYFNSKLDSAHHDIILPALPFNVAVQCKNSLTDPDGSTIAQQLDCDYLLWFYPGCHEDQTDPPMNYRTEAVIQAVKEKRIGFLSGAGCASILSIDLIRQLKIICNRRK